MYELGIVDVRAVFDGTRMRQIAFTDTEVASSETARNIDGGVVPTSSAGANSDAHRADLNGGNSEFRRVEMGAKWYLPDELVPPMK